MTSDRQSPGHTVRLRPLIILAVVGLLVLWFAPAIFGGYHLGCNQFDHLRLVRLGVEFCK